MSEQGLEAAHLIDRIERLARSGVQVEGLNPAQWVALRYLARANRFSRTPAALADYLASTRGTVSQTLIALEGKGFVTREPSERDKRSIDLQLTRQGKRALENDPLAILAGHIENAAGARIVELIESLRATLASAIAHNKGRAFGACYTCRHFQRDARASAKTPHHCRLLDEPLSEAESHDICVEQELMPA